MEAKSYDEAKSSDEATKTIPKKYNLWNKEFVYFTWLFINYNCIIDSC